MGNLMQKCKELEEEKHKLEQKVIEVISEFAGKCNVCPKAALQGDLFLGIIKLFDLTTVIEGEFKIDIIDETVGSWVTVQDVINTVNKLH